MKILVCIKAVPEPEHAIHSTPDGITVCVDSDVELRMGRFDEFAVEEAVLIKEKFAGTTVDVITVGPENARKIVRRAMGMGADNGIHLVSDYGTACDASAVSAGIAAFAEEKTYDVILCGIMSEDVMQFSTGPMIAGRLSIAWATSVVRATPDPDHQKIRIERELEGGVKAIAEVRLPALLTIQSGINEPRYPSLSNLLRANKAELHIIDPTDTPNKISDDGPSGPALCETIGYAYPEKKRAGRVLTGTPAEKAESLYKILREKGFLKG